MRETSTIGVASTVRVAAKFDCFDFVCAGVAPFGRTEIMVLCVPTHEAAPDPVPGDNPSAANGNGSLAASMSAEAEKTKQLILTEHWSDALQSFAVISPGGGGVPSDDPTPERGCNLSAVRPANETVRVRELLGFMPFYFGPGLVDKATLSKVGPPMWKQLFDAQGGFAAPWGCAQRGCLEGVHTR